MITSLKWIQELLKTEVDTNELNYVTLNLGLEIESVDHMAPENIIVGIIKKITPHPKSNQLSVLDVDIGHNCPIVTAAKNIKLDDRVLVCTAGNSFKGTLVKDKDFHNIKSKGILISEEELGLADKSGGVIILENGKPGEKFQDLFDDIVLDIKATPNRPDWLSVEGIAREIAVGFKIKYSSPYIAGVPKKKNRKTAFPLIIKDIGGCPRYTARIFEDVKVAESPFEIKWRLHCMGMNAINNIVDITNIMMLMTGQPLHPFDLDLLHDGIIIRKANKGEDFISLEGSKFELNPSDLLIADHNGNIALAGIIGAQRSQISSRTRRVLLESAYFDPKRIAHTSRRLGLLTEASTRFERGGDIAGVDRTSALTAQLFKKYAEARETEFIAAGKKIKTLRVDFSVSRSNQLLSLNLSKSQIIDHLKRLGIKCITKRKDTINATIPHYRRDLKIEEDIFEEIARVYGYMNIPEVAPRKWGGHAVVNRKRKFEETIRGFLFGQGFSETYNLSLTASKTLTEAGFKDFVTLKNPMNERFDALRPTLFLSLTECVNYNIAKSNKSLKLFEIGNILLKDKPFQEEHLGVIMGGEQFPNFWQQHGQFIDYYQAKGVIEGLLAVFRIKDIDFTATSKNGFSQVVSIQFNDRELGYLGCVDQKICKDPFFYFEIVLEQVFAVIGEAFFIPPPKFPVNTRDLSFLVVETTQVPDLMDLINKVGSPVLEKVNLFDYYKGDKIDPDKKNLGFRLYFRAPDRTLTDREVDIFIQKIEKEVTSKYNAQLRKRS
ncbi:phenylalanine--tRNA ligase subunit beta [candidate division WOR-3 bacterium RBG_13_43_14]|uniref:Phenylalanine--tRNA ligase beta subunit n=1 Tax=candidate division WOR-3 bacterium RBG_13_43_14 TaxID=1802590 RepID=A0A1F4U4H9_UNCW3|nr:MAG: phenylalanine--tRNA ligase subunit beta [candidate division WOR-3 bacterium RBG_13_43_14]